MSGVSVLVSQYGERGSQPLQGQQRAVVATPSTATFFRTGDRADEVLELLECGEISRQAAGHALAELLDDWLAAEGRP